MATPLQSTHICSQVVYHGERFRKRSSQVAKGEEGDCGVVWLGRGGVTCRLQSVATPHPTAVVTAGEFTVSVVLSECTV